VEAIVVVEMPVRRLEGKFKLSQNKPAADVAGVLEGLAGERTAAAEALAALMRGERR
jgi:transcriptional regulator